MAAAIGLLDIFGMVSGGLGIVQFGLDNFSPQETVTSVVRIAVGLDIKGGLSNAGGDLPDVRLFNEAGEFLGISADPGRVGDGAFAEIKVYHKDDNNQQAPYALFSANDDAICVAYASITWPNGDKYAWIGDWGEKCGGSFYFSNLFVNGMKTKPNCLRIDANGDQPQTGTDPSTDPNSLPANAPTADFLCNAGPPFKLYTDQDPRGIVSWTLDPNGPNKKRSAPSAPTLRSWAPCRNHHNICRSGVKNIRLRRQHCGNSTRPAGGQNRHNDYLVLDSSTEHLTAYLCGHDKSVGPDFANLADGQFCHLSDKTLWPICGAGVTDNCFDWYSEKLVVGGKVTRDKAYDRITSWGSAKKES